MANFPDRRLYGWPVRFKFEDRQGSIEKAETTGRAHTNQPNAKLGFLYRFDWSGYSDRHLQLRAFPIVKETPRGFRIAIDPYGGTKWIMGQANKFASKDIDAALLSYRKRKQCYIAILKSRLEEAEASLRGGAPVQERDLALAFLLED